MTWRALFTCPYRQAREDTTPRHNGGGGGGGGGSDTQYSSPRGRSAHPSPGPSGHAHQHPASSSLPRGRTAHRDGGHGGHAKQHAKQHQNQVFLPFSAAATRDMAGRESTLRFEVERLRVQAVRTSKYCPPRHPTHFAPLLAASLL